MQLTEITFDNFRCFNGVHKVYFSPDDEKMITLFHAQNGSGKTTFLNAILWAFYGTTTGKFEYPDQVVNDDALKKGKTKATVTVGFEHQGENYALKRTYDQESKKPEITLFVVKGGSLTPATIIRDVETFIESVIPSQMAPYFFFDGEHAETLTGDNKKSAVGRAVRSILGCDIAEEAIEDLKHIRSKIRKELQKLATSADLKEAYGERDENEKKQHESSNLETNLAEKIDKAENKINSYSEEIGKLKEARDVDSAHQAAVRDLERLQKKGQEINKPFYQWVDTYSFSLVGSKALEASKDVIEQHEFEARIPEQYSEPFIESLIENELCICGRSLEPNSKESNEVKSLLDQAANSEHIQRFNRVNGTLGKLKSLQERSFDYLQNVIRQRSDLEEAIEDQKNKESKLKKQLRKINSEEFQDISTKRKDMSEYRDKLIIQRNREKKAAEMADQEIKKLDEKITTLENQSSVGESLRQKIDLLDKLVDKAEDRLNEYVEGARLVFEKQVNFYLEKYARKQMTVKINSEFSISVRFSGGSALPKSSGENQFISIVFTAVLVNFAKSRSKASGKFLQPGTIAPLFLDAPLGQLDKYYQLRIAEIFADFQHQLVLLLTDSQGNSEFLEKLGGRVGQHWLIIRHSKEEYTKEKPIDKIVINGREYERCLYSQDQEYSSFMEVQ